jgi:DNA gyrase/topoisomerase IV subunit A
MKEEILTKLSEFRDKLLSLKKDVLKLNSERVQRKDLRDRADQIATMWVEELRSPLEHKFKLDLEVIKETAEQMKHLHIISRPNNRKSSYTKLIKAILKNYDNRYILPIKQAPIKIEKIFDLEKIIPTLHDPKESEYLKEAIDCANSGFPRAAIVLGWCAAIDRIQKKIQSVGFNRFNQTSTKLKQKIKGKFAKWNKEFNIATLAELQTIFDTDLIIILEGMEVIDGNQADRLINVCYQYRNQSAHPGEAPIEEAHVVSFFTDINKIILLNPKFILNT